MAGPLEGVRVVELTSVVLGPWACQILADMGADVVKIEAPAGDSNRQLGAFRHPGMAALYLTCNRNKRSIVLDLKQPAAKAVVLQLVKSADVVVHNNRPQVMTRLGLDYALRAVNGSSIADRMATPARGLRRQGRARRLDPVHRIAMNKSCSANRATCRGRRGKTTAITVVYGVLAAL
jgi:hypothetical protein